MRQLTTLIIPIVLVALSGQAMAQFREETRVYEKTDQEGVPSYSDIPSQGARPVIIPPANQADRVDVRPPASPDAPPVSAVAPPEPGTPEYEQKVQRQLEDYRQKELEIRRERHGPTRHKVGTGEDSQRREVGDNEGT